MTLMSRRSVADEEEDSTDCRFGERRTFIRLRGTESQHSRSQHARSVDFGSHDLILQLAKGVQTVRIGFVQWIAAISLYVNGELYSFAKFPFHTNKAIS